MRYIVLAIMLISSTAYASNSSTGTEGIESQATGLDGTGVLSRRSRLHDLAEQSRRDRLGEPDEGTGTACRLDDRSDSLWAGGLAAPIVVAQCCGTVS